MKSLSKIILVLLFGFQSCKNNSDQIKRYKNEIVKELTADAFIDESEIIDRIEVKLSHENNYSYNPIINNLIEFQTHYFYSSSLINNLISIDSNSINHYFNYNLNAFASYKSGKDKYYYDTITPQNSIVNVRDTATINEFKNKKNILLNEHNSDLSRLILIKTNNKLYNTWYNRFEHCGFNFIKLDPLLHYENKVLKQNELKYIVPGYFEVNFWSQNTINIFKENSNELIMENEEPKVFTNPVQLEASSKKGVHTVKGLIHVKEKGELVPKPFEFRYIVE